MKRKTVFFIVRVWFFFMLDMASFCIAQRPLLYCLPISTLQQFFGRDSFWRIVFPCVFLMIESFFWYSHSLILPMMLMASISFVQYIRDGWYISMVQQYCMAAMLFFMELIMLQRYIWDAPVSYGYTFNAMAATLFVLIVVSSFLSTIDLKSSGNLGNRL